MDDLISRSAVLKVLEDHSADDLLYQSEYEGFKSDINAIPAIDAVPVVHGFWKHDRTNIVCSVCGTAYSDEIVFMKRGGNGARKPQCCPECGARMDAKEG